MINGRPSPEQRTRLILAGIAVGWVLIVTSAYFAVHKPANTDQLKALGRAAGSLAGLIGTFSLAMALGQPWRRVLEGVASNPRIALQAGAGLATLAYLVLALGAVGLYKPVVAWAIVVISLPLGLPRFARAVRDGMPRLPVGRTNRWLAAFVIGLLVMAGLRALAPPTAWDSLVYHLTGPRLYLEAGRLHHDLDLPYLGFPQAGSMLFLWGMLLTGDRLSQLIHLMFALLTLALLPAVLKQIGSGRSWLAAAIMIGVPSAYLLAGWAYVEWMVAFAGLASFIVLTSGDGSELAGRTGDTGQPDGSARAWRVLRIVLAGFLAALAVNTKYTAVWLVLGLGLVAYLRRRSPAEVAIFVGSVGVFALPFLLKNQLLSSNPFYPFFFPGKFWDAHRAIWYSRAGTGLDIGQLLLAPWEATVWGVEGAYYEGHPSYGATLGPLLLALVPLALLRLRTELQQGSKTFLALLALCLTAYLGWLVELGFSRLLIQSRLLFPILPQLAILATAGFDGLGSLGRRGRSARFIIGGLLVFSFAITAVQAAIEFAAASPARVVTGSESVENYLEGKLGQHAAAMRAIRSLPDGSRVRFLWEPRSYYCSAATICEPDALTDRWWHERQHGFDAKAISSRWRHEGVTHILFYRLGAEAIRDAGFDPLVPEDWKELERFLADRLVPEQTFGDAYILYRLP